jgi:dTDP-4-dehydrorhamnose reductase
MKILILGAAGMAGSMITKYLSNYYDITAWTRDDFDVLKNNLPNFDVYDYVINCIGIIKQKASKEDDKKMFQVNTVFPHVLSLNCKKLIHISSDCVFSGKIPKEQSYSISDVKDAEDSYGQSKADGEPIHKALVLRTSIIGPAKDNFGLFEWFKNTQENPVKGFENHLWSGITTLELAKVIHNIIDNNFYSCGLYQIASEKISKLNLLLLINSIFDLNKNIISCMATDTINRSLIADIKAKDIHVQLLELKEIK